MKRIYGTRPVIEAIEAGKDIEKIFLKKGMQGPQFRDLFAMIRRYGIPFQFVPPEKLNRLYSGKHQGVIALLSVVEYQHIESVLPGLFEKGEVPFILVLDRVTDVRNMGAIARSAEAAGCHALVVPGKNAAMINEDAVKTSAGALMHLPLCRTENLAETILFLKNSGLNIIAGTEKGTENFYQPDMTGPLALILGSEEKGIDPQILKISDHLVTIPMLGKVESLNVSVAAGILMYEVVKQRMKVQ
ncbi:MAG: 23S rRNA (guanosine(2251)-2'-O)-methyltransferase RlmB [Bacteroidales bacterium]|nr:23S rRNA (guanosine(2251)-2'-O)-methyltransferase RlmB [Bacteroidales bacterium]